MTNNTPIILVIGGAGFIGSNFIIDLLSNPNDRVFIINLDKLTYAGNLENLSSFANDSRYVFIKGDLGDSILVNSIFEKYQPNYVVNFAAETHVDRSISGPADFINTNIVGTYCLLECVRNFWSDLEGKNKNNFRFLHVSTDEVYGSLSNDDPPFLETTQYAPNSPYSASKAASDHLVRAWHHTYGIPVLTTNCSNNYGPFQFPEKLIPLIILNALAGKNLPVYGDGLQIRDWLYVKDHCRAIKLVLQQGRIGETYNIGGHNEKVNIDIVKIICALLDDLKPRNDGVSYSTLISYVKDRQGHDRRYAINASKIESELGWRPVEVFESGILKTIQWYIDNSDWLNNIQNKKV